MMFEVPLNKISVVIAAGGFASRFGGGPPKSLRTVGGKSLLEYTVASAACVGFESFTIFNNRPEFNSALTMAMAHHGAFEIVNDQGARSTFQLARQAALSTNLPYILFMYGHAPRPCKHLRNLLKMLGEAVVVTAVGSTTKLCPVPSQYGYLEPPYIIPTAMVQETDRVDWKSFLTDPLTDLVVAKEGGPGEVNLLPELSSYAAYYELASGLCNI